MDFTQNNRNEDYKILNYAANEIASGGCYCGEGIYVMNGPFKDLDIQDTDIPGIYYNLPEGYAQMLIRNTSHLSEEKVSGLMSTCLLEKDVTVSVSLDVIKISALFYRDEESIVGTAYDILAVAEAVYKTKKKTLKMEEVPLEVKEPKEEKESKKNRSNASALIDFAVSATKHGMTYGQLQALEYANQTRIIRKW